VKVSIEHDGPVTRAIFDGKLTEDADLAAVLATPAPQLVLDLGAVTRINSAGVREWIRFMSQIPTTTSVTLRRCPTTFLSQASLISNFLGRAAVESFYLPYLCPACETSRSELLTLSSIQEGHAPPARCTDCGADMEVDVVEEQFFFFLR
jgi:hypothetical protein